MSEKEANTGASVTCLSLLDLPQADKIAELRALGWEFHYESDIRFVGAKHPRGGSFTVCEVIRSLSAEADDLGHFIAAALNNVASNTALSGPEAAAGET